MTMICKLNDLKKINLKATKNIAHDYLISSVFASTESYCFCEDPLVMYRQHHENLIGMGGKKKKKKISLRDTDFPEKINRDLVEKITIMKTCINFCRFNPETNNLANPELIKTLDLYEDRALFRKSQKTLIHLIKKMNALRYQKKEIIKIAMKDIRCRIKLKLHFLILRIGKPAEN